MMSGTKKVGTTGRFGSRYGRKIRLMVRNVEKTSRAESECPFCFKTSVSRQSAGIWVCKACGNKFTGGAYAPVTSATKIITQALTEKKTHANAKQA